MYEKFSDWYAGQLRQGRTEIALVLHTSCVNYADALLEKMERIRICWILPRSVRYELGLLAEGPIFHRQARRILRRAQADARRFPRQESWDLEQLYRNGVETPAERYRGTLVFWFGDLNKQDEFLWNVRKLGDRHRILLLDNWNCSHGGGRVCGINEMREVSYRRCQALSRGTQAAPPEQMTLLDGMGRPFPGRELTSVGLSGGHATIYESGRFPGQLVKIYNGKAFSGNQRRKLERLCQLGKAGGAEKSLLEHLALPEQLIRTTQGEVVGYTMRRCPGRPLRDYRVIGWDGHDQARILRQLLGILLHLHTMRVLVNDLSFNNVLVDENDRVSLVDCDSFQVFYYPGGGVTEPFRHPELEPNCAAHLLKEPRHEYFSLAVLLYQFLFHADPLRPRQNTEGQELTWNTGVFPLDVRGEIPGGPSVNACICREWMRCPEQLRKLFSDEFHFREDHSFGAWIEALGLCDPDGV